MLLFLIILLLSLTCCWYIPQAARQDRNSSKPAVKALRSWHRLAQARVEVCNEKTTRCTSTKHHRQ